MSNQSEIQTDNLNKMNNSNQSNKKSSNEKDINSEMIKLNDILTINDVSELILKLNFNTRSNIIKKLTLLNNLISIAQSLNFQEKINLLKENNNLISDLNELPIYLENKTNLSNEQIIEKYKDVFKELKEDTNKESLNIDNKNFNKKEIKSDLISVNNDDKELRKHINDLLDIGTSNFSNMNVYDQCKSKLSLSKELLNMIVLHYHSKVLELNYKNYLNFNLLNQDDIEFTELYDQFQNLQKQLEILLSKKKLDQDSRKKEDKISRKQEIVLKKEDNSRSEGVFSFKIKNVSIKYSKRVKELSDQFYVRDLPWRLSAKFSKQNGSLKFGLFLECDSKSDSLNWSCRASANLFLISQTPTINHIKRKIDDCVFNSKEYSHGFEEFTDINNIIDSDNGYFKNDSIILQVYLKANLPTGLRLDLIANSFRMENNFNHSFSSEDNDYDNFLKEIDIMLNAIKRFNPKLNEISTWFTNYETYCKLFKWTDNQIYYNLIYFLDSSLISVCINDKNNYNVAKKRIIKFINDLTYSDDHLDIPKKVNEILEIFNFYKFNYNERIYWLSYYLPIIELIKRLEDNPKNNDLIQLIKIYFL